jgi:hypothetical protein
MLPAFTERADGVDEMANALPGIIAAQAAQAGLRRMLAEEEKMTGYSNEDLEGDWEFKILRANSAAFRKPEDFRKVLEEEARAGWELVEKFDNSRIRFKRRVSSRRHDEQLLSSGVDPYRVQYGPSLILYRLFFILVALSVVALPLLFSLMLSR